MGLDLRGKAGDISLGKNGHVRTNNIVEWEAEEVLGTLRSSLVFFFITIITHNWPLLLTLFSSGHFIHDFTRVPFSVYLSSLAIPFPHPHPYLSPFLHSQPVVQTHQTTSFEWAITSLWHPTALALGYYLSLRCRDVCKLTLLPLSSWCY